MGRGRAIHNSILRREALITFSCYISVVTFLFFFNREWAGVEVPLKIFHL
jgi:hypothetical protein